MRTLFSILASTPEKIAAVSGHFAGWLVVIMMLLVLFEVVMRYVFLQSPLLADELSRYMVIAMTFIGLAFAWKEKAHVRVEALVTKLPAKISNWLRLFTMILALVLTVAIVYGGYFFLERSLDQHRTSDSWLRVPQIWPEMTVVVGFLFLALVILASIIRTIKDIRAGKHIESEEMK